MLRFIAHTVLMALVAAPSLGQTPQPFPRPGGSQVQTPPAAPPIQPAPARPQAPPPQPAATQPAAAPAAPAPAGAPDPATLGAPLYPTAQFIASYDAGRGQRYFIYGATAPFADIVTYYRTQLDERGNLVFREPPTHMFEVGRFRDETMAFPPGVTVKDWTWAGSAGYPNPAPGAQPTRFPTTIMIVPAPPAPSGGRE